MSVELAAVSTGGRRLSFQEAVEGAKQSGSDVEAETDIDGGARVGEVPELRPYEPTLPSTKTDTIFSTLSFKSWSEYRGRMEIPEIFKLKILWVAVLVVLGIAALLIVILVPLHFADLNYWEVRV